MSDDREQTNVLVLAGPGSGKTRVLVHRIAYLVRVKRENPRGILAMAYNRHAAVEIRRRLADLIGDDARAVTVLTCHALAMRLVGASFAGRANRPEDTDFQEILRQAVALLQGKGLPPDEADENRARLMSGFRWILVDEYQDIGPDQYALISALAGRTLSEEDDRLSLFAVGDDDQNIYGFSGSSVAFIHRFEADYAATPGFLTDNYRSTAHIIGAANAVMEPAKQRMKTTHPIHIDRARAKEPPGGVWSVRARCTGAGADTPRWRYSNLPSAGGDCGAETVVLPHTRLELVPMRGGGSRMELPGSGAQPLRASGYSGADGERGLLRHLAPAGDTCSGELAARRKPASGHESGHGKLGGPAAPGPLDGTPAGSDRRI